jgi:flagellar biogenesis protein FliO
VQQECSSAWRHMWRRGNECLLLSLIVLSLSLVGERTALSTAAESRSTPTTTENSATPAASQEHFLQHFISRSLVQKTTEERQIPASTPTSPAEHSQGVAASARSVEPASPAPEATFLNSTVTTMVLSLAAILGSLLVAAYLIRRYFLSQTPFGKRAPQLRVLARTYLTPKALVALVEVPGKTFVIGVTGSTIVSLGEAGMNTQSHATSPVNTPTVSFAAALEQSTHALNDADQGDETLLQVSERIQRKVSRLKQL